MEIKNENNPNEPKVTDYDRVLRLWQNSMEMVRDFEMNSKRMEDENLVDVFKRLAEEEGKHASELREILVDYNKRKH